MTTRRNQLLALLALVVLVGVAVFLFVGNDDDDDADGSGDLPAAPTLPEPVSGALSAAAEELLTLLDRAEEGRYHAVYEVEGDPAVIGGDMTLELWRDGGWSRRDTRIVASEGSADSATIVEADGRTVTCNRLDEGDWTCFEAPTPDDGEGEGEEGEADGGDAAALIGSVRDQLAGAEVTPRDDEIDGREVRCFEFETTDGPGEICANDDGVVVRLASGETAMVLTDLDDDIPGDVFTPPAELSDPPEPPTD